MREGRPNDGESGGGRVAQSLDHVLLHLHSEARRTTICGGLRRRLPRLGLYLIAIGVSALFAFPLFWAVSTSLKTVQELHLYPPRFLPEVAQFENYAYVWKAVPYGKYVQNSLTVSILGLVGQLLCSSAVAYGFAKFRFPGRDILFLLVLSTLMLPREVTIIPLFLLFKQVGWLDSLKSLIIPQFFGGGRGAFFIFLMRQFFLTIPTDLVEAARIDGAGSLRIFWSIIVPLSKPALSSVAIFAFLWQWNEFLGPLIYLNSQENFTLPLGLRYFQTIPTEAVLMDNLLMAASVMYILPPIVIFFLAQRYFVQGIVTTGIRG